MLFNQKKRVRALLLAMVVTLFYTMFGGAQPSQQLTTSAETLSTGTLQTTASSDTSGHHEEASPQETAHHSIPKILATLMLILMVAKLGGDLLERFGQPAVLGELIFGIVLGNLALLNLPGTTFINSVFHDREVAVFITMLAELGVILLLFEVGLESTIKEMLSVGPSALIVALLGIVAPMGLGFMAGKFFLPDSPWTVHLFLGAVLAATSVGITARVLKDLGKMDMREAKIILGAAVIDDILGLVVLAVASGAVAAANAGQSLDVASILLIVGKASGFFIVAILLGALISPKLYKLASYLKVKGVLLSLTLAWCFLVAWLGSLVGVAPIVGAFAAGLVLEDATFTDWKSGVTDLEELIKPITAFLVPVFFVHTGMTVDLATFANAEILGFAAVLTIFAIIGKQVCSLGVWDKSLNRTAIGIGMIPRGEVGLIVASIGRGLKDNAGNPIISANTFSAAVIMVVLTTMVTPPALKWALDKPRRVKS